jgi:hypothetical protein
MIQPLEAPDSIHLQAAEGWIVLGNYAEANDELEQIAAANRAHPDVLQLRWRSISHSAVAGGRMYIHTTKSLISVGGRLSVKAAD